ncbi:MAG: hypothetical protein QOJ73_1240 [Streptosporangiaceae bacterium]|jgi:uncharacterized membrane protein YphA (DoxX/SURF4 family)|nr:hypothetical protein [Streptosporangiaceae bacterium]
MSPARSGPAGRPGRAGAGTAARAAAAGADVTSAADRAARLAAEWGPVAGRVLLALVLAWFGYHELVRPALWTGYVPVLSPTSTLAVILVLAHGWVLLVVAVALAAGIAPRAAALFAAALLLEIVISLAVQGGLSDLTLRDVGVLGLALCLTGVSHQRLALRR